VLTFWLFVEISLPAAEFSFLYKIPLICCWPLYQQFSDFELWDSTNSWACFYKVKYDSTVASLSHWASTFVYNSMDVRQRVARLCLWKSWRKR